MIFEFSKSLTDYGFRNACCHAWVVKLSPYNLSPTFPNGQPLTKACCVDIVGMTQDIKSYVHVQRVNIAQVHIG